MTRPKHIRKPSRMPGQEGPTRRPAEPTTPEATPFEAQGNAHEQGVGYEGGGPNRRGGASDGQAKPGYEEPMDSD